MENFSYSVGCDRRGIMICLEYQSVCPFVRNWLPFAPLSRNECVPPPLEPKGGGGQHSLVDEGAGGAIRTTGENAWHSVNSVAVTVTTPLHSDNKRTVRV